MTEGICAYIGIGSNVGDSLAYLRAAVRELTGAGSVVTRASSIYETEPVGIKAQNSFLNAVVEVRTTLDARAFHARLKETEGRVGRRPRFRWGPREIDLDLLLFGDVVLDDEQLILPHPRLHERAFVMVPFAELAPDVRHPRLGATIRALREQLDDPAAVRYAYPPEVLRPDVDADDSRG